MRLYLISGVESERFATIDAATRQPERRPPNKSSAFFRNTKETLKRSKISLLLIMSLLSTVNSRQYSDNYLYRLYITAGIYLGYSTGALIGIGPKFSIGFRTYNYKNEYPNTHNFIANNFTAGYIRHFGTKHQGREFLLEFQALNMRFSGLLDPDCFFGGGAGISFYRYYWSEDSTLFYLRPRISVFAGNFLFLNASKTFGLLRDEGYTGLHIGGTAVIGFPFWFLLWD